MGQPAKVCSASIGEHEEQLIEIGPAGVPPSPKLPGFLGADTVPPCIGSIFLMGLDICGDPIDHGPMTGANDQRNYINDVLAKTGWSQTDLANRAGLDPSTLSRFLTKTREGHALRASTLQRIARVTGLAFGDLAAVAFDGMAETEATPYTFSSSNEFDAAIRALCQNHENTDAWVLKSRALENLGYRAGDILIVGLAITPLAGDIVCAQVYDWGKGQAETIFRLYNPPALIGSSNDPEMLKPFLLSDNSVVVKGVVLHSLRSR